MTIWLLALVLMAGLAGLGFRQGAVRMAISFFGILIGALLAGPLGRLLKPVLLAFGLKNPTLLWLLGAPIVFVIISIIFKIVGLAVHQKVDVHFRYNAGDLRQSLWERLNARTGLCIGLFNGAAYLVLISFVIYMLAYWTFPLANSESDPKWVKIVNRLGQDLKSSGFSKVARAIDPMPQLWYDAADLAALLYYNPLADARLARYPGLFHLAERPEFQELGNDQEFIRLRQRQAPVMEVFDHGKVQAIFANPELLSIIWKTVVPDMPDLRDYLKTGRSKYDAEKILGHWKFNVNVAMAMMRRSKPNISSTEMQKFKRYMTAAYAKTSFVAMPDHKAVLRSLPPTKLTAAGSAASGQSLDCQWDGADGKYQITISSSDVPAAVENDRLTIGSPGMELVFDRED